MNFSHLDEKELNLFSNIHQQILPRRTERYKTLKVNEKDILCFPGNIQHYPQPTSGFGCRDLIAFFIYRT